MGAAVVIDPPEQITACNYCVNGTCKRQASDEAPVVGGPVLTMLWGFQTYYKSCTIQSFHQKAIHVVMDKRFHSLGWG
eukprot:scaffold97055_cov23-Cyclotella_meneghiniana.AAC.1